MLKDVWKTNLKQGTVSEELKFVTSMVRKDVIRTDRTNSFFKGREDNKNIESLFDILCTYSMNHPEVSYCQGMSDMAAVLLVVQNDEANAYLCFCAIMKRLKYNFMFDGKAMTCKFDHLKLLLSYYDPEFWTYMIENEVNDLFFTYRWLLLEMKREFAFNDALYMLEVMWSTLPIDHPLNGVSLSDVYCTCNNSLNLIPKQLISAVASSNGFATGSGTPTPYTKLLSLVRKSSAHSNTPSGNQESIKQMFYDSQQSLPCEMHNGNLHDQENNINHSLEISVSQEPQEFTSKFYIDVVTDKNGVLQYKDELLNSGSLEIIDIYNISTDVGESIISTSSMDSGIRSHPVTPVGLKTVGSDLQFAFETSDGHKEPTNKSVFPSPDEFGYGNPFLMCAAFAMILQHRDHIMKNKLDFDSIVMLFDRKVRKNDVHKILYETKLVYEKYVKEDLRTYAC